MRWDLDVEGAATLALIAIGFGLAAALLAVGGWRRRAATAVIATTACVAVGVLTSEWLFGWATEEDLQPNVGGLSRDEVLLSSFLTTVAVVLVTRSVARGGHRGEGTPRGGSEPGE